jgi:hypothetical protein
VLAALLFGASGIAPTITKWHDESSVTRTVFFDVPSAIVAVFYGLIVTSALAVGWLWAVRVRNWQRGQPENRTTNRSNGRRRLRDFRAGVLMKTLMRDPAAGVMHSLIYFPFLVLFAVTITLEVQHQLPPSLKFLHGRVYQAYSFVGDLAGLAFVVGVTWALVRRYVQRPYRIRIKTRPEDAVILGNFWALGVTGFLVEAVRIASMSRPNFERWSFIS